MFHASPSLPQKPLPTLLPREHGAYVELLAPLLTALLFLPFAAAGAGYAVAACALFLMHEPLLIVLGRRGERTRKLRSRAALRRLWAYTAVGGAGLTIGLALASSEARLAVLVPVALAALSAGLVATNREKELAGQLFIGATLASFSLPVLVAAGLSMAAASWLTVAWSLVNGLGTLTGRAYVYRKRDGGRLLKVTGVSAMLLLVAAPVLASLSEVPRAVCYAAAPTALIVALLGLGLFQPRSPKPLGWALAAANVCALVLFGIGLMELA